MGESNERWSVDLEGSTLLRRYTVERAIGAGGMANVYRARDEQLEMPVVVKVPHVAYLAEPGFKERFDRETRDLIALQHPHVVRILARGEHEGLPFLVLQFLRGGSLGDRIRAAKGQPIAWEAVRPWVRDVARALDFIHEQGVVHRDVKPDNVLFDEHGHGYLSDFGIAKAIGQADTGLTVTGMTPGSPAYMAPEQPRQSDLTGASDQYSLAASLYEALTGRPTHEGETAVDVLLRKQTEQPTPIRQVVPGVPREVAEALERALAREPADRFESCTAMVAAMQIQARPATPARSQSPAPAYEPHTASRGGGGGARTLTLSGSSRRTVWMVLTLLVLGVPLALVFMRERGPAGDRRRGVGDRGRDPGAMPAPPAGGAGASTWLEAQAAALPGTWVIDREALERQLRALRSEGKRPPRLHPQRAELERALKGRMALTLRADGGFELVLETRERMMPEAVRGAWSRAGDILHLRPDPDTLPTGVKKAPEPFLGRIRRDGLVFVRKGFEVPLKKR